MGGGMDFWGVFIRDLQRGQPEAHYQQERALTRALF
jgi:hypothetical protein